MITSRQGDVVVPGCSRSDDLVDGPTRARARSALHSTLLGLAAEALLPDHTDPAQYALQIEAWAVHLTAGVHADYLNTMARVRYNLQTNGELIIGTYPVSRICRLSHRRLQAETEHATRDAHVVSQIQDLLRAAQETAEVAKQTAATVQSSYKLRCPKCKRDEGIIQRTMQLNRADEGMKTKCLCSCGYNWGLAS